MFVPVFLFRLRRGGGLIFSCYGCKLGPVMAVIFIEVKEELYFFLGLVRGGAKLVGTAEFAFKSGCYGYGVLAGLGFDCYVCVTTFTVNSGGDGTIILAG